jgi:uncharacterized protein
VRFLPVFNGADAEQNADLALSEAETLAAYIELFELWLASDAPIVVEPLSGHVGGVISALTDAHTVRTYDKRAWEPIYLVNTDGNVYSYADAYDPKKAHGNLFTQPMAALVGGERHLAVIADAERRMEICGSCRHYGAACTGYPMAEESPGRADGGSCIRERGILDHIEQRLLELRIVDTASGQLDPRSPYHRRFRHLQRARP